MAAVGNVPAHTWLNPDFEGRVRNLYFSKFPTPVIPSTPLEPRPPGYHSASSKDIGYFISFKFTPRKIIAMFYMFASPERAMGWRNKATVYP